MTSIVDATERVQSTDRILGLEADLKNAASIPVHHPTGFGAGERYGPIAGHAVQFVPGGPFIGSPGRAAGVGRDDHGALKFLRLRLVAPDVAQAKDRAGNRRAIGDRPGFAAVTRDSRAGVIGIIWVEITAAENAVLRAAEIDGENARGRSTE